MNRMKFEKTLSNLWVKYRFICLVCLTQIMISAYGINRFENIVTDTNTILIPMGLDEKVTISGDKISGSYFDNYARTIMDLAFIYNPETAKGNFNRLLACFHPSKFPEEKKRFEKIAQDIIASKTSSVFYAQRYKISADKKGGYIDVTGLHQEHTETTMTLNVQETYRLEFERKGTHLMLLTIKKLDKNHVNAKEVPNDENTEK